MRQPNSAILAALWLASSTSSVAEAQQAAVDGMPAVLIEPLREGARIENYVAEMVRLVRSVDRADDGLDADDIRFEMAERAARTRAGEIQRVLTRDFDGDFRVTREEIEWAALGQNQSRSHETKEMFRRFDGNRDGAITLQEIAAGVRDRGPTRQLDDLLALDPDGDAKLSAKELRLLAQAIFEALDKDGDGELSKAEFSAIEAQWKEARLLRHAATCPLPPVPANAKLVLYGSNDAQALSSVAIGGNDKATTLLDVAIEPGSEQLYLILVSRQSMLWRLSGETRRVAHVIVSSSSAAESDVSASGVVGMPQSKVTISRSDCPEAFGTMSYSEPEKARASIQISLRRPPDIILSSPKAQRLSLPSGDVIRADERETPVASGFDPEMWKQALQSWEAGVVTINPRDVIARTSVESYQVMPGTMGLAQLIGSGTLVREASDRYRLVRPIPHFPINLNGGQSFTLVIAKGVPVPAGEPGYICLISEETGEALTQYCRPPAVQATQ